MAGNTVLIDTSLCTACRGCQVACKSWNELPAEKTVFGGSYENPPAFTPTTWTRVVFREADGQGVRWYFGKQQCMHCRDAVCVNMCPVQAAHRTALGTVDIDTGKCIGCGICQTYCPFQVPKVDKAAGKSRKCRLCFDRITNGLLPACVQACPSGALSFGSREEILARARERAGRLKQQGYPQAQVYGEKEMGGLHIIYVLTARPSQYGLPEEPKVSVSASVVAELLRPFQSLVAASAVFQWAEGAGRGKRTYS
ncbi:MAG: 4Fe-4S dicluster domain-containing protein [Clostridia bacterium]|nr:MAG: 4Fe-4S dicluster domain-containing protein [Clostridia bacterium]